MPLTKEEIDLIFKSQNEDEEEARYWENAELNRDRIFIGPRGGIYYLSGNSKRYI